MARFADVDLDLNEVNDSELVALCRWAGFDASRAWPREVLLDALLSFDPPDVPGPLDEYRAQLSKWLNRYWRKLQMQTKKKVCPNCHMCSEIQVLDCYGKNKRNFVKKGPR